MSPDRIAALAAELTEADLYAILRAKAPATVKGHAVKHVCFNAYAFGTSVTIHAAETNAGGATFAEALSYLDGNLRSPADTAAEFRAEAERLIAEAAKLEAAK